MNNEELINDLVLNSHLITPKLIQAFKKIDRANFVLDQYKNTAYLNEPLPIGEGQTISQPLTVAFMLELLSPMPGEKILEIGSGSGWQTALLAEIVGPAGHVVSVERISDLKEMTEKNVRKYGFIDQGIVKVIKADGSKGYEKEAPYDKVIVAASAPVILEAWKKQLKIGGRIVAPVGNSVFVVDKISETDFEEKNYSGFSFVPLITD